MKVLVVEDDDVVAFVLMRILEREFDCIVSRVSDGLDGLETISRDQFNLVLLDINMPVISGLEMLQAIRSSREHRHLPVVIVSGSREEHEVRQLIELGITDYLTKPLKTARVTERLTQVFMKVATERLQCVGEDSDDYVEMKPGGTMLIVDEDAEFRRFFAGVLEAYGTVLEASSGTRGLRMCLETPPEAVFLGPLSGPLRPDLVARKIRDAAQCSRTRLVAVAPESLLSTLRRSGLFDASIVRTFVPEKLNDYVGPLFRPASPFSRLNRIYPRTRGTVTAAVEQVFGMMLGLDVALGPGAAIEPEAPMAIAEIDLRIPAHAISVMLQIGSTMPVSRAIAARLLAADAASLSDDDVIEAIAEIANMVVGRLHRALEEHGVSNEVMRPQSVISPNRVDISVRDVIHLTFESAAGLPFGVRLAARDLPPPENAVAAAS